MSYLFLVVAVDYDGTIAEHDRPAVAALDAIDELRANGRRVLLCTGRRLENLQKVFPEVDRHFDAVVAENGGLLAIDSVIVHTEDGLPPELGAALNRAGIPHRAGHVLLATEAEHDEVVLREIERLGLEAQLVYNRGALMILPAGVSKGAGLLHALDLLELSPHSAIGIGDAENDHSLLHACEIGVAVGNAVPGLRAHADLCLTERNGAGVATFLRGPVLRGDVDVHPQRWHAELGRTAEDEAVRLPGSRINVLIAGASCSGKSHLAGLLIERLVALEYCICILDAEGDHVALDRLPGVIRVGGIEPLPSPERLAALLRNRLSSVVVDLSLLSVGRKREYCSEALAALCKLRLDRGLPHWLVIEEADQLLGGDLLPGADHDIRHVGCCFITHRPTLLHERTLSNLHAIIALPGAERYAHIPFSDSGTHAPGAQPFVLKPGEALLAMDDAVVTFQPSARALPHVRHHHKYMYAQVPPERRFFFGPHDGRGRAAGNMAEFRAGIADIHSEILRAHLAAGDLSRWTRDVVADDELGGRLRGIERWFSTDPGADPEMARTALIAAITDRYGTDGAEAFSADAAGRT